MRLCLFACGNAVRRTNVRAIETALTLDIFVLRVAIAFRSLSRLFSFCATFYFSIFSYFKKIKDKKKQKETKRNKTRLFEANNDRADEYGVELVE